MTSRQLVGMIHLQALPGSPGNSGLSMVEVTQLAIDDALRLAASGFSAVLVQNTLDRPTRASVASSCVAQMAVIAAEIKRACSVPIGINVHKNDGPSAIAIAAAVGASFVRVKVHTGAVISAEGIVQGDAYATLALRKQLNAESVQVWADVHELTSRPLAGDDYFGAAHDAVTFGAADALIVTRPTLEDAYEKIAKLQEAFPGTPVMIGGGVSTESLGTALQMSDGVIVGRGLKAEGSLSAAISPERAKEMGGIYAARVSG